MGIEAYLGECLSESISGALDPATWLSWMPASCLALLFRLSESLGLVDFVSLHYSFEFEGVERERGDMYLATWLSWMPAAWIGFWESDCTDSASSDGNSQESDGELHFDCEEKVCWLCDNCEGLIPCVLVFSRVQSVFVFMFEGKERKGGLQ